MCLIGLLGGLGCIFSASLVVRVLGCLCVSFFLGAGDVDFVEIT